MRTPIVRIVTLATHLLTRIRRGVETLTRNVVAVDAVYIIGNAIVAVLEKVGLELMRFCHHAEVDIAVAEVRVVHIEGTVPLVDNWTRIG